MDTARFDNLVRSLAGAASRRGFLAGLAGGMLAFMPGSDDAEAKKKKKKKKKKRAAQPPPASPPVVPPPPLPFCSGKPDGISAETFCGATPFVFDDRSTWYFCSGGVCGLVPECGTPSEPEACDIHGGENPQCCDPFSCSNLTGHCGCVSVDSPCYETFDCCGNSEGLTRCVGFVCRLV
jgi:hypothetical protein